MRLAEGLAVAHVFIGLAYLVGSNATWWDRRESASSPSAMVRLICTCALGFSIAGFGTFALACAGWFTPVGAALMLALLFSAGCLASKSSPFRRAYWASRWRLVRQAFDLPNVVVYFALLVVAFPAVNVANAGSDALAFHWAYAIDWIHAHGLTVDPFLREPFYAENDLLLVALIMLFGGSVFAQFAMWAMGLLTALGVCAGVRLAFREGGAWPGVLGVLLALAAVYSPAYLRWMDSGYLDAALGFFALASVLALQLALQKEGDWRWLLVSAAVVAFLIGSKTSLLPFIAVYAVVFLVGARALACTRKQTAAILAVLVVLALPWYARNFILAGDIIPPILNIVMHGSDGIDTKFDLAAVAKDFSTERTPAALLTLPVRAFLTPDTLDFREFGQNALILLIYVPSIVLFCAVFPLRRKISAAVTLPVVLLTAMIGYWFLTSTSMRYSLLFFPLLALCCGLVAGTLRVSIRRTGPIFAALAAATLIITPNAEAHAFYSNYFVNGVLNPPKYYTSDEPFLQKFVSGYSEEQFTARALHELGLSGRLYLIGTYVHYYYRRDGIESVGDWVGPAAVFWLYHSAATRQTAQFLDGLGVDAVLFDPANVLGGLGVPIERQLTAAGYCRVPLPDSQMVFLVHPRAGCAQVSRLRL